MSWRYVLLFGLLPAGVAFIVRMFIREPERWTAARQRRARARARDIRARNPQAYGERAHRHVRGADHLVDLQRVHPVAREHARGC